MLGESISLAGSETEKEMALSSLSLKTHCQQLKMSLFFAEIDT